MGKTFQIAIDGPVAAGKGTTAKMVAARLGFLYVDTGAMYRCLCLLAKQKGIDPEDEAKIAEMLSTEKPKIELSIPRENEKDGRLCTVKLNGIDVSWNIRTEEISKGVSIITQYSTVRDYITPMAREIADVQNVVMEGRDITTVVLPEANLKIFMDADPAERATRRHKELMARGEDVSYELVYNQLVERDKRDSERVIAPLKKAKNAWILDTTGLNIDQVAELIVNKVESMK
ncbi:MAG: (d)CMP kinase [bacterium]